MSALDRLLARKMVENHADSVLDLARRLRAGDLTLDEMDLELGRICEIEEQSLTVEERRGLMSGKVTCCVYCSKPVSEEFPSCCGEFGHTEQVEVTA